MNLSAPTSSTMENMMYKKKTAAIYARVSSLQQKDAQTINSQIDTLKKFAKENGFEVPEDLIFQDDGYSGSSLDRPGLDSLRDSAREYHLEAILVYSPDRLSRRLAIQLILEEEFRKLEVKLHFFKGKPPGDTPEDNLLAHFQAIFAEYERAQILDRTRRGKLYKLRQGDVRILPQAPLGYHNERDASFYTIKERDAKTVREIFRLFTKERLNLVQIAKWLEETGIATPKGGLKWDRKTISGILKNPAYIGTAYYGKTEKYEGKLERTIRYKKKGKITTPIKPKRIRSTNDWEPISVPQIIIESDFEMAQELLRRNKELASRNTKEPSILQGLLVCGLCGCSYYKKARSNNNDPRYICRSHLDKKFKKCGNRSLQQETLDKLIWKNLIEILKRPELIEQEIDRRCSEGSKNKAEEMHRKVLEKEIKQIEKSHNKLLDAYQDGDCLTLEELRKRSKQLKEKENILKKELNALEANLIKKENVVELRNTLDRFRMNLDKSFKNLSIKEKQQVVRLLIEDIIIFPEEIEIKHQIPIFEQTESPLCGVIEN